MQSVIRLDAGFTNETIARAKKIIAARLVYEDDVLSYFL